MRRSKSAALLLKPIPLAGLTPAASRQTRPARNHLAAHETQSSKLAVITLKTLHGVHELQPGLDLRCDHVQDILDLFRDHSRGFFCGSAGPVA
jgi:hypothetical protein